MHSRTLELLASIGLGRREMRSLELAPLFDLPSPRDRGFGLIGPTGTGKTWRLVQALGTHLDGIVMASEDPANAYRPLNYAEWVNWPDAAEKIKGMVAKGYHADIVDLVESWETCGLLFLDDLGQERVTGENDYSLGVVRSLLDQRYRADRPVYWTSNLGPKDLVGIYGARMVSRMKEAWPWTVVERRDMRLAGGPA
nr:hypothetical protein [uncultured Holophaga sp.]